MVVEGAEGMVVGDQPELGAAVPAGAVRPDVAQDVLMPVVYTVYNLIFAHFVFLRYVWIGTQRAALASRRATNLATHLPTKFAI